LTSLSVINLSLFLINEGFNQFLPNRSFVAVLFLENSKTFKIFLAVYIWPHGSDKEGFRFVPGYIILKFFAKILKWLRTLSIFNLETCRGFSWLDSYIKCLMGSNLCVKRAWQIMYTINYKMTKIVLIQKRTCLLRRTTRLHFLFQHSKNVCLKTFFETRLTLMLMKGHFLGSK
jgi:hypothetical protein